MWTYSQSTGTLAAPGGAFAWAGYAGTGIGRNNPAAQGLREIGPLPRGQYHIGPAHHHGLLGPVVMQLTPAPGNQMWGRSAFFIHGDSAQHDASHGCIILPLQVREMVAESSDRELQVAV